MLSPMISLGFYLVVSEPDIPPGFMHVHSPLWVVLAEAHLAANVLPCPQLIGVPSLICQQPGYACSVWKCMRFQTHHCVPKCMSFQTHVSIPGGGCTTLPSCFALLLKDDGQTWAVWGVLGLTRQLALQPFGTTHTCFSVALHVAVSLHFQSQYPVMLATRTSQK
jgi:hypothetical protein